VKVRGAGEKATVEVTRRGARIFMVRSFYGSRRLCTMNGNVSLFVKKINDAVHNNGSTRCMQLLRGVLWEDIIVPRKPIRAHRSRKYSRDHVTETVVLTRSSRQQLQ
jgi:hypothetical protein